MYRCLQRDVTEEQQSAPDCVQSGRKIPGQFLLIAVNRPGDPGIIFP
jgi:hypothetical protein